LPTRAAHVTITGRVQGVGFRAWVWDEAEARHLSGWVRNRRDGSVEAVFSGEAASVEAMLAACRIGPLGAAVADLYVEDHADAVELGFRQLPTQ
jgi:acylphosphatase